jgi:hypothetical protein
MKRGCLSNCTLIGKRKFQTHFRNFIVAGAYGGEVLFSIPLRGPYIFSHIGFEELSILELRPLLSPYIQTSGPWMNGIYILGAPVRIWLEDLASPSFRVRIVGPLELVFRREARPS